MDIKKKLQETLNQSVSVSKKYLDIAKEKAKDFGDLSVKKLEFYQLEERFKKLKNELGETVYEMLSDGERQSVSLKTAEIKTIMEKLDETHKEIMLKTQEKNETTEDSAKE